MTLLLCRFCSFCLNRRDSFVVFVVEEQCDSGNDTALLAFTAGGHIPEFVVPRCGRKRVFSATLVTFCHVHV